MGLPPSPFRTKLRCDAKLYSGVEDNSHSLYHSNQGLTQVNSHFRELEILNCLWHRFCTFSRLASNYEAENSKLDFREIA
jgi:hypothetical protein